MDGQTLKFIIED